jgi:hypothetical protein
MSKIIFHFFVFFFLIKVLDTNRKKTEKVTRDSPYGQIHFVEIPSFLIAGVGISSVLRNR